MQCRSVPLARDTTGVSDCLEPIMVLIMWVRVWAKPRGFSLCPETEPRVNLTFEALGLHLRLSETANEHKFGTL